MAGAELGAEVGRARQRQERAGELDLVRLADHDGAVVQLVVARRHEQRDQQLAGQRGVDPGRVVDELLERRVALEHDDRAHPGPRDLRGRGDDLIDDLAGLLLLAERHHVLADPAERAPDVLLEHDDDQDDEVADEVIEQPRHGGELEALGDEERGADQHDADDHLRCARPADRQQQAIDQIIHERDVDHRRGDGGGRQAVDELVERRGHGNTFQSGTWPRVLAAG